MDYGYITLDENMSKNGIKYEFGKRYKEKIEYSSFLKVDSTDNEKLKYIEIEIFDRFSINKAIDFKIIKEVNYLDFYKPELKNSPHAIYILAMKCKDEESLKVLCTATSEKAIDAVISSNVDLYINYLLSDPHNHVTLKKVIKKYGRNNLLDKIITGEITNISSKVEVAKIGRPQDLDVLVNDRNNLIVGKVLENGRFKDIDYYLNKSVLVYRNFDHNIIRTGIDKYLDNFTKYLNSFNESILMEIAEIGRKKDLDILVKSKSERIRSEVAKHGFNDHLDILVHDKSSLVLQSVLDNERKKDLDIILKTKNVKELDFTKEKYILE